MRSYLPSVADASRTAEFPAAGTSPADVTAWWNSLTPQEQQQLIADRPDLVGPLDGVSAVARDQANRKLLDAAIMGLTVSGGNPGLLRTLTNLRNKLDEGGTLLVNGQDGNAPMAAPGDDQLLSPQMFLLGFSPDGQGRAIIAAGNPDTADNVVAYVPGMGTYLSDHFVSKDVLHAQNIAVAAGQADPSHTTSAVIWLGYDAPQVTGGAADWAHELDITGTGDADAGAPAYQHFLAGLRAANTSGDLNLTALGHSYGSLLVGKASQLPGGLGVDNVVIVGSPGVGFDHASQFGIDPSHVWAAAAANDPVPKSTTGPAPQQWPFRSSAHTGPCSTTTRAADGSVRTPPIRRSALTGSPFQRAAPAPLGCKPTANASTGPTAGPEAPRSNRSHGS